MFHVLRHTFASVQLQAGESPAAVAEWMGHASPTITLEHYAHFMPEAGRKGMAVMDARFMPALALKSPRACFARRADPISAGQRPTRPVPRQVPGVLALAGGGRGKVEYAGHCVLREPPMTRGCQAGRIGVIREPERPTTPEPSAGTRALGREPLAFTRRVPSNRDGQDPRHVSPSPVKRHFRVHATVTTFIPLESARSIRHSAVSGRRDSEVGDLGAVQPGLFPHNGGDDLGLGPRIDGERHLVVAA
ncbi:tyrosine-type recombinase/integrase [Streptomyces sp. TRM66268-LWL]|uniref:Tyrosine-type recombinase/integrase n=1 Tax=Streptomyces polyasparticus TaxID=2767826 RepID=A0ABR7SVL6_9ACTN|nr:tyrosine-type recombinase/integrase [Streptomyces polyasparticus]MBC9719556.1 tyrosine-type recombinase/integrase [Streptomyces polyasparticus]